MPAAAGRTSSPPECWETTPVVSESSQVIPVWEGLVDSHPSELWETTPVVSQVHTGDTGGGSAPLRVAV
jgi:hypothetical protein